MKRFAVLGLLLAAVAMMVVACTTPAAPAVPAPAQGAEAEKPAVVTPEPETKPAEVETAVPETAPVEEAAPAEGTPEPAAAKQPTIITSDCVEHTGIQITQTPSAPSANPVSNDACFVPRQLIMYGTRRCINKVTAKLDTQELKLSSLREIVLQGTDRNCPSDLGPDRFKEDRSNDTNDDTSVVMRLYGSDTEASVQKLVMTALAATREEKCLSITEPNYLIGDPGTLKGSPWIPVGSPDQGDPTPAPISSFPTQPAFPAIGLSAPATTGGKGVRVGVFDTSPTAFAVGPGTSCNVTVEIPDAGHEIGMRVTGLESLASVASPPAIAADHGLFVAGLVKAVAPEADVQLYRVLDEYAVGDLFTLMEAIKSFICTGTATPDGLPSPSVINLSLGLHWYPESAWPEEACGSWISDFAEIWSLQDLLDAAYKLGVVVVAAAGNNANNAVGATESADVPAAWPNTIGVAATNVYGTGLACFSNAGNVWAPGGEGVTSPSNTECKPQFKTCNAAGDCADYGLVSLGTESSTGYWYWAGTSFAAPLVSGLVARCLQEAADAGAAWPAADVPANVWKAIQAGAASHNGVIHVGDTLAKCK